MRKWRLYLLATFISVPLIILSFHVIRNFKGAHDLENNKKKLTAEIDKQKKILDHTSSTFKSEELYYYFKSKGLTENLSEEDFTIRYSIRENAEKLWQKYNNNDAESANFPLFYKTYFWGHQYTRGILKENIYNRDEARIKIRTLQSEYNNLSFFAYGWDEILVHTICGLLIILILFGLIFLAIYERQKLFLILKICFGVFLFALIVLFLANPSIDDFNEFKPTRNEIMEQSGYCADVDINTRRTKNYLIFSYYELSYKFHTSDDYYKECPEYRYKKCYLGVFKNFYIQQ